MALPSTCGTYVAWGKWLDHEFGPDRLYKVGHTGDLFRRLEDSSYVTCFPPGHWKYVATFEFQTKEEAFLLETAVLHCCREFRLGTRELVNLPAATIIETANAAAREMGLAPVQRAWPTYYPGKSGKTHAAIGDAAQVKPPALPNAEPNEPSEWAAKKALVEALTVHKPAVDESLENLVDGLLSLDWKPEPRGAVLGGGGESTAVLPVKKGPSLPKEIPKGTPASTDDEVDVLDTALERAQSALEEAMLAPLDLNELVKLEERVYQKEASAGCLRELKAAGKTILQLACRCGKTPIAYNTLREFLDGARDACGLYLVPGLPLLRQTAQKLAGYGYRGALLLVGSDPRPVKLPGGRETKMTTDPATIGEFCKRESKDGQTRLVISTYQSSGLLPTGAFALTVFDEAHRVCGGAAVRPFNTFLLAPQAGARLFMTATPAYEKTAISMKDKERFGGVAYRYHLRQGIDAGYVNDFRLELIVAQVVAAAAKKTAPKAHDEGAMPGQIVTAMGRVDKLLVFCRDIGHSTRLCEAVRAEQSDPAKRGPAAPFECLVAHSRMRSEEVVAALQRLAAAGVRAALFSVRMFQEGVEVPALNGVFFAAPRHSPRDIIQSLCRPLNRVEGKPVSVVFLPVACEEGSAPDSPENLKRFASIVPFVDALLEEDARLYDHLLDPGATPYPIELLGTHSLKLPALKKRELFEAVRRVVRYGTSTAASPVNRLLRTEVVPWIKVFAEIKRIVEVCNRYPKTTDAWVVEGTKVCFHRFYKWAAAEYENWRDGKKTALEPHQVADLETLPQWKTYGVNGPYWWEPCIAYLEKWLEEHEGTPPCIEINVGGWVGLDASMMERLSGAMTCVNQQTFGKKGKNGIVKSGCRVPPEHQRDLDRICERFSLRWRKVCLENGEVDPRYRTFIQEAFDRFKKIYRDNSKDPYILEHFKDYPLKHLRQESLDVQASKTAPPRWKSTARKGEDKSKSGK
jgi:superfamily II DNA or RNA helicase